MILLKANSELQQTFERLIQTMKVPVKWDGIFAVVDNYIILQGEVRSLFFHFDTRKAATNIIEIPTQEQIPRIVDNVQVQNAINMILYAFGKWGTIGGVRVDKNYAQLNQLFTGILQEVGVEPEYTPEYFRFYRSGMRITYEDVIQMAIEHEEENAGQTERGTRGLWRKIVWKKERTAFAHVETSLEERRGERLGNNFYMVGYLCPGCGEKLHMVVYPVGKEFRIETEEGGVLLARACACGKCNAFYTPRPKKMLSEGDVYTLQFGEDKEAYEDYLELLGRKGERGSNYRCNEFADGRKIPDGEQDGEESLEELIDVLPELSELELKKIAARIEEGFYPDESIRRYERKVKEQREKRQMGMPAENEPEEGTEPGDERQPEGNGKRRQEAERAGQGKESSGSASKRGDDDFGRASGRSGSAGRKIKEEDDRGKDSGSGGPAGREKPGKEDSGSGGRRSSGALWQGKDRKDSGSEKNVTVIPEEPAGKYEARLQMLDRYSERQIKELKSQLEREEQLSPEKKREYLAKVEQKIASQQAAQLADKVNACEGKSYVLMKRILEEVEEADLPPDVKQPLWEKLSLWKSQQAKREVEQLVQKMPANLDRKQYKQYIQRIRDYEDVDLKPYEEKLRDGQEAAQRQEIANMVKRARKVSREELSELAARLKEEDFLPELVLPYLKKVEDKIRQMDAEALAVICPDPMHMSFEEGMQAYEQIGQGDFLPELKTDMLKLLSKRLAKIKTDECELLVKKLELELTEAGVAPNSRHHFYPARKVLLNQAGPEEIELIDFAMASYAAGRGLFEYPILVVDATRNGTGKEGIILTPDHLYYSTLLNAYGIPVASIESIRASAGLLNKGLFVQQKDGTKTRIPYAVETKELPAFAQVLGSFVHYLQEKPDSRNLTYLAREKHETICCFRCGYEYKGGNVCPKCGYQNNE